MKSFNLIIFFLFLSTPCYADVFDRLNSQENKNLLEQAISKDERGYYYRAYTDNNLSTPPNDPQISTTTTASLGCSNFDFNTNFLNQFKTQALSNTLISLGKEALAASPMLLLEYASPTLADLLKHFSTSSSLKLGLLYAQCEDIEKAVGNEVDKLRKKSEKACVDSKSGDDLDSAIKGCKAQKDPFAFLKDSQGNYLLNGGKINVLQDILDKLNLGKETKEELLKRSPNKVITASSIKNNGAEESIETAFYNYREQYFNDINDIYTGYQNDSKSITKDQLDSISMPGVPVTKNTLESLAMLDKYDRQLKFSQMASSLANFKTINKYREYVDQINSVKLTTVLDEEESKYLDSLAKYYEDSIKTIESNTAMRKEHASILEDTITEAEKRKLRAISQLNTSDKNSQEDKFTAEKGMLMIGNDK